MKLLAALSSVKLFVALAVIVAVLSLSATLIPQGEPPTVYAARFGPPLGGLIVGTGMDRFFTSPLLLVLALAAELNLTLCTLPRLARCLRHAAGRSDVGVARLAARFAADVIHLGLIVLIAAALVTLVAGERRDVLITTGEAVAFRGTEYTVLDSRERVGATGEFESVVLGWEIDLLARPAATRPAGGQTTARRVTIGTNRPSNDGGVRGYFFDWSREPQLRLQADDGTVYRMLAGEGFALEGDRALVFDGRANDGLRFVVLGPDAAVERRIEYHVGDHLGPYRIAGVDTVELNGFRLVSNPARPVAIVGFVLVVLGMMLYAVKIMRRSADRQVSS